MPVSHSILPTSMSTVQLYRGKDKQWYLRLVSINGEPLAQSEGYSRRWNAKRAARKNFSGITIVELPEQGGST